MWKVGQQSLFWRTCTCSHSLVCSYPIIFVWVCNGETILNEVVAQPGQNTKWYKSAGADRASAQNASQDCGSTGNAPDIAAGAATSAVVASKPGTYSCMVVNTVGFVTCRAVVVRQVRVASTRTKGHTCNASSSRFSFTLSFSSRSKPQ